MRSLVQILCFAQISHLSLQAAPENPRLPKLGPTIVEKPFKIDEDLALILNVVNKKLIASKVASPADVFRNVTDILTLNGMDKKTLTVKNLIDLLTSRTYKQRMQLSAAYEKRTHQSLPSLLQNSFGPPFNGLFMDMKALLGIYVQNSLDRAKDWAYMSILCTSSASQLQMLKDSKFTYKPDPVDTRKWEQVALDEFMHKAMVQYQGKKVLSTIINADPLRPDSGVDQSKFEKQLKAIPKHNIWFSKMDLINWSSPSDNAMDNDLNNAILYGVFNGNTGNCP
ncbi:hypothetical protein LSTR_LSTR011086 [Laodelphax striatellus]|uniref:Uncharacterized protein n=1 Tax=Laodelphax striatellus TaxID=195883 RepID=A0A482WUR3_LAOST|nr:hypothetical protein LSTR_LSTR011086 [Laodelphax striatellus]